MKKMLSAILAIAMLIPAVPSYATEAADEYFTEQRTVNYDNAWAHANAKPASNFTADTDYVFTVKNGTNDESFTLLDVDADNDSSKYFVIANQTYGKRQQFAASSDVANYWKNPTAEEKAALNGNVDSIAAKYNTYWLDANHFEKGWGLNNPPYLFGTSPLVPYIDNNHVWTCEPAPNAAVPNEKYTFTAGIALPSASEINTYLDRFGISDTSAFGTRTMINHKSTANPTTRYMGVATKSSDTQWLLGTWALPLAGSVHIRPVCWLNSEFFANVPVDLTTAGAAVKQEIKKIGALNLVKIYEKEDLKANLGFTDDDFVVKYFTETRTVDHSNAVDKLGYVTPPSKGDNDKFLADPAYVFTVGNETFTLLDATSDSSSKYFVIANQVYGDHMFKGTATDYYKMPTAEEKAALSGNVDNIAAAYPTWWLNAEHFQKGWGLRDADANVPQIADNIRTYIDKNHVWECEPAPDAAVPNEKYSFTAGIAFPSVSEIKAYDDRLGVWDAGKVFVTRTMINLEHATDRYLGVISMNGDKTQYFANHWTSGYVNVRPVFYLNDQFFANVAVDLATAGDAVKQEIKKVDLITLLEIYSADDLIEYLGVELPEDAVTLYNVKALTRSGEDPAYGETLVANYDFLSGAGFAAKETVITWKKSENGVETVIGTGENYIVTEADANTGATQIYFDIKVTGLTGNEVSATSKKVTIPSLGVAPVSPNYWTYMENSADDANKFTLDGKSFTLIDSFDNDESTFFVTVNDNYGRATVGSAYMDPTDVTNYAYWMNTTFKNDGNGEGNVLPEGIIENINYNHIWLTEGAPNNPIVTGALKPVMANNYTYTAGITPLSVSEYKRYNTVLGSVENVGMSYTRTAANWTNSKEGFENTQYMFVANKSTSGEKPTMGVAHWDLPTETNIRPAFYLTKDFFKEVELDWDSIGENVMAAMRSQYYIEDLDHLYDVDNMLDAGFTYKATLDATFTEYGNASAILETLNGATSLQAVVTLETATEGINAQAILALYDDTGALAGVTMGDLVSDTTEANVTIGFETLSGVNAGYYAKLMVWDSMDSMSPVTSYIPFDSNDSISLASSVSAFASDKTGNNFFGVSRLS